MASQQCLTIYARSSRTRRVDHKLTWSIDILNGETLLVEGQELNDPQNVQQKDDSRWYLEQFVVVSPYKTTRARKAANDLQAYALSLRQELKLTEINPIATESSPDGKRILVIEVKEDPLENSTSHNSIHQLHWELLEQPDIWGRNDLEVRVRRSVPQLEIHRHDLRNYSEQSRSQTFNILLVVARDTSRNMKRYEIDPTCASRILAQLQRSITKSSYPIKVNLEIVRPGTLASLEEHLATAEKLHYPGYFHIVHFDLHGEVHSECPSSVHRSSKDKINCTDHDDSTHPKRYFSALKFSRNDTHKGQISDKVSSEKAVDVARILKKYGVTTVVLNACESARANCGEDSNTAKLFAKEGVLNILAMSFLVLESAAKIFLKTFYTCLVMRRAGFAAAAARARETLRSDSRRCARFNLERELVDWFVPVVYSAESVPLGQGDADCSVEMRDVDEALDVDHGAVADFELVGRDFDVLRLEKRLLLGQNLGGEKGGAIRALHLFGQPGVGKSALLQHIRPLWTSTYFVDAAVYIDFASRRFRNIDDFVTEILVQLPEPASESGDIFEQLASTILAEALRRLRELRFALILDGLHAIQFPIPDQHGNLVTIPEINEFLELIIGSQTESAIQHRCYFIFSGRLKEFDRFDCCAKATPFELCSLEPQYAEELLFATLSKPKPYAEYSHTQTDDDYCELLASLLQCLPAVLLHFGHLARRCHYSVREMYEKLHCGMAERHLEMGPDYKPDVIFQELDRLFTGLSEEFLPQLLSLGWYWHEVPSVKVFKESLVNSKICNDGSNVHHALEQVSNRGYITLETDNAIETDQRISGIHPFLTIYCRIISCAMVQSGPPRSVINWPSFRKAFEYRVIGHATSETLDDLLQSTGAAAGSQGAARTLASALGVISLRNQNFQYFCFAERYLSNINRSALRFFVPHCPRKGASQGGIDYMEVRARTTYGLQNILFASKICVDKGQVPIPLNVWPQACLISYGHQFRKVATIAELRLLTEHLEKLLDQIISQSVALYGAPAFEANDLHFALTIASSLAVIHLKFIRSLSSDKPYQKFIDLGIKTIEASEAKFPNSSLDPNVLQQRSLLLITKAEVLIGDGREEEADVVWKEMLSLGDKAMGMLQPQMYDPSIQGLLPSGVSPISIFEQLRAWYEQLEKSWELLKAHSRGERNLKTLEPDDNMWVWDRNADLMEVVLDQQDELERLGNMERGLDRRGNPTVAFQQHLGLMVDAFENLDLEEAGNHIAAAVSISEQDGSGSETADKLRNVQEHVFNGILKHMIMPGQDSDLGSAERGLPEMMDDAIKSLKEAGASTQSILFLENSRGTLDTLESIGFANDPKMKAAVNQMIQKTLKPHISKVYSNSRYGEEIFEVLLEIQSIYQELETAEKNKDYERSLELFAQLDELSTSKEEFSDVISLVKDNLPSSRRSALVNSLMENLKSVMNATTAAERGRKLSIIQQRKDQLKKRFPEALEMFPSEIFEVTERLQILIFSTEAEEALSNKDYPKCYDSLEKLFARCDSGCFTYLKDEILADCLQTPRLIQLKARLYEATGNERWKDGITCCEEWQQKHKSHWSWILASPDGNEIVDIRDSCECFYHFDGLQKAIKELNTSDGFYHLEKLQALQRRQQKLPNGIKRKCPELTREVLTPLEEILISQSKVIATQGLETAKTFFSKIYNETGWPVEGVDTDN